MEAAQVAGRSSARQATSGNDRRQCRANSIDATAAGIEDAVATQLS
ncbi:hypothetical protein BSU04_06680 [Caballeronia sordidicola]|uniref:Uncharacterized protein n=1 Tax=Caballeronia sordidicola TaxID=196367 RepID=A0A226X938_CABSO|nr:hypothetical protein BSU04_06680 [Caballeronia sordidicola]